MGAYSTFTLGHNSGKCGFGIEMGGPPSQNVYIGLEGDLNNEYRAFPFYHGDAQEFKFLKSFKSNTISRMYNIGTDIWKSKDLTFTIYTPSYSVPNPQTATDNEMKKAIIPAVFVEMTVDNTKNKTSRKAFFGYESGIPNSGLRHFTGKTINEIGIANGREMAIVTNNPDSYSIIDYDVEDILAKNGDDNFSLGSIGSLVMNVAAHQKVTFHFAVCFFKEGVVTSGLETRYYYTKFYKNLEDVASYALKNFDTYKNDAIKRDDEMNNSSLSQEQKFQICHSIKSYYGNTQLLDYEGHPLWVVNEGEYRIMNTLDLEIDQLFYELKMNPWTVRNVLEMFVKWYSYSDEVNFKSDFNLYPGGRSFTHDMGVANNFSRFGYSAYEKSGIEGCFSYMTCEQLVNWILCASVYISYTNDTSFCEEHMNIFIECLESMVNRDNPNPEKRNGLMSLESSRTVGGEEITTYDALDASIGQSRNSAYLGMKRWAAYLALDKIFKDNGLSDLSKKSYEEAKLCAKTIAGQLNDQGYIPGVLFEDNTSKVIPIIEGLIYPYYANNREAINENGEFGHLIKALKRHLNTVLVKGNCIFEDGGWRLSSSSINSWLSKIYLCQFIARKILGLHWDDKGVVADKTHVKWLLNPELSSWCFCDQIFNGTIKDSKYYPRGVTSILWMEE